MWLEPGASPGKGPFGQLYSALMRELNSPRKLCFPFGPFSLINRCQFRQRPHMQLPLGLCAARGCWGGQPALLNCISEPQNNSALCEHTVRAQFPRLFLFSCPLSRWKPPATLLPPNKGRGLGPSAPGSSCRYWIVFLKYSRPESFEQKGAAGCRRAAATAAAGPQASSALAAALQTR